MLAHAGTQTQQTTDALPPARIGVGERTGDSMLDIKTVIANAEAKVAARRRTQRLTVACPVCHGTGKVELPSHDGSTDRGCLDPAGMGTIDDECGCTDGKVELILDLEYVEDMIAAALAPAIEHAVRGFGRDDREWLRDDVSTTEAAREILAGLTVSLVPK